METNAASIVFLSPFSHYHTMTQSTVNPAAPSSTSVPLNGVDPSLEGLVRGALNLGMG